MELLAISREIWFAGTAARSTPIASPPRAIHASSAKHQATAACRRQIKITPAPIATAAAAHHIFGDACHRIAMPMPAAKAAAIHSAGNFIRVGATAPLSPYERSEEKDQTREFRCSRSQLLSAPQDRAPAWAVRKKHK